MDLEDIFENLARGRRGHHDRHGHHHVRFPIERLLHGKMAKLILVVLALGLILLLVAGTVLAAMLLPLAGKTVDYAMEKGLQGALEPVFAFLQRLWKGNGAAEEKPAEPPLEVTHNIQIISPKHALASVSPAGLNA